MNRFVFKKILFFIFFLPFSTLAQDLIDIYQQAVVGDPTFRKANADWLAARQNLPLAISGNGVAGTGVLPNIDFNAQISRNYNRNIESGTVLNDGYFTGNQYGLLITQPIFNYATWKAISNAKYSVKSSTATYFSAEQDLMFRTAQAYFNVLSAKEILTYDIAQKNYLLQELNTQKQKFKVGLIAITDVYNAQASYDTAVAQAITDQNNLQVEIENLRAITGFSYCSLKGLKQRIPLVIPQPQNIDQWVVTANRQNYTIQANLFAMFAAREAIKQARAGNYPTLSAQASYQEATQGAGSFGAIGTGTPGENGIIKVNDAVVSLNLDFPAFRGGYDTQNAKKIEYQFLSASDQLEFSHRDVTRLTRQAYLGVESGISQIEAAMQTIISNRNQLAATQAGYQVGTRTMVDVLSSVSELYNAQKIWANDRYQYLISLITLKKEAGTLSPRDLIELNRWLGPNIALCQTSQTELNLPHPEQTSRKLVHKRLPKSHAIYNIRLYIASSKKSAEQFLNRNQLEHDSHIQIIHSKRNRYVISYGHFHSYSQAKMALKKLPYSVKKYNPWIVKT